MKTLTIFIFLFYSFSAFSQAKEIDLRMWNTFLDEQIRQDSLECNALNEMHFMQLKYTDTRWIKERIDLNTRLLEFYSVLLDPSLLKKDNIRSELRGLQRVCRNREVDLRISFVDLMLDKINFSSLKDLARLKINCLRSLLPLSAKFSKGNGSRVFLKVGEELILAEYSPFEFTCNKLKGNQVISKDDFISSQIVIDSSFNALILEQKNGLGKKVYVELTFDSLSFDLMVKDFWSKEKTVDLLIMEYFLIKDQEFFAGIEVDEELRNKYIKRMYDSYMSLAYTVNNKLKVIDKDANVRSLVFAISDAISKSFNDYFQYKKERRDKFLWEIDLLRTPIDSLNPEWGVYIKHARSMVFNMDLNNIEDARKTLFHVVINFNSWMYTQIGGPSLHYDESDILFQKDGAFYFHLGPIIKISDSEFDQAKSCHKFILLKKDGSKNHLCKKFLPIEEFILNPKN